MTAPVYDEMVRDALARASAQYGPRTRVDGIDVAFTPAAPLDEDGAPLITCEPYPVDDRWRWMWMLHYGTAIGRRDDTQPLAEWVDGDVPVDELVQQARRHLDALADEDTAADDIDDDGEQDGANFVLDNTTAIGNTADIADITAGHPRRHRRRSTRHGEGVPTRLLVPLTEGQAHVDVWRGRTSSLIVLDGVELSADEAAALARALAAAAEAVTAGDEPEPAEVQPDASALTAGEVDLGDGGQYTVGVHHPGGRGAPAAVWARPGTDADAISCTPDEARADAVDLFGRAEGVADHEMTPAGRHGGPALTGRAAREIAGLLFTAADVANLADLGTGEDR